MVDGDQRLAAFAHPPLRVEEFFGRGLVGDFGARRDVAQGVSRLGPLAPAAEQPATLKGRRRARALKHLFAKRPRDMEDGLRHSLHARGFERAPERDERAQMIRVVVGGE